MHAHTVTYTDFNEEERTETFYFNLTEDEIIMLQAGSENGLDEDLLEMIRNNNVKGVLQFFKDLVHQSYGIKSVDGRYHVKTEEELLKFKSSAAYSGIILDLWKEEGQRGVEFFNALFPKDVVARAQAAIDGKEIPTFEERLKKPQDYKPSAKEIFDQQRKKAEVSDEELLAFQAWRAEQDLQIAREADVIQASAPHEGSQVPVQQETIVVSEAQATTRRESRNISEMSREELEEMARKAQEG